jgi:hypothetical protein
MRSTILTRRDLFGSLLESFRTGSGASLCPQLEVPVPGHKRPVTGRFEVPHAAENCGHLLKKPFSVVEKA